jgi:molecular chaperone DnaJ
MNLGQYNKESKPDVGADAAGGAKAADHQDEGFLKNMWHNISGQHKAQDSEAKTDTRDESGKKEDEKK